MYSPFCQPLIQRQVTEEETMGIFDCLNELYDMGIVHRDLSNNHFMKTPEGNVALIDFGSSVILDDDKRCLNLNNSNLSPDDKFRHFHGSVEFAAKQILMHLAYPERYANYLI